MAEATQGIGPEAQIAKDVEFVPSLAQAQEVQEHSMADKEARESFVDAVFRCGICYSTIKGVYLNQEIYKDFPCTAAEYPQKSGVSRFCIMRCGHLTCLAHLQLNSASPVEGATPKAVCPVCVEQQGSQDIRKVSYFTIIAPEPGFYDATIPAKLFRGLDTFDLLIHPPGMRQTFEARKFSRFQYKTMLHNAQTANAKIWQLEAENGELHGMLDVERAASDQTRDKLHEALRRKLIIARELQRVEGWTGQQRLICAFLGLLEPIATENKNLRKQLRRVGQQVPGFYARASIPSNHILLRKLIEDIEAVPPPGDVSVLIESDLPETSGDCHLSPSAHSHPRVPRSSGLSAPTTDLVREEARPRTPDLTTLAQRPQNNSRIEMYRPLIEQDYRRLRDAPALARYYAEILRQIESQVDGAPDCERILAVMGPRLDSLPWPITTPSIAPTVSQSRSRSSLPARFSAAKSASASREGLTEDERRISSQNTIGPPTVSDFLRSDRGEPFGGYQTQNYRTALHASLEAARAPETKISDPVGNHDRLLPRSAINESDPARASSRHATAHNAGECITSPFFKQRSVLKRKKTPLPLSLSARSGEQAHHPSKSDSRAIGALAHQDRAPSSIMPYHQERQVSGHLGDLFGPVRSSFDDVQRLPEHLSPQFTSQFTSQYASDHTFPPFSPSLAPARPAVDPRTYIPSPQEVHDHRVARMLPLPIIDPSRSSLSTRISAGSSPISPSFPLLRMPQRQRSEMEELQHRHAVEEQLLREKHSRDRALPDLAMNQSATSSQYSNLAQFLHPDQPADEGGHLRKRRRLDDPRI